MSRESALVGAQAVGERQDVVVADEDLLLEQRFVGTARSRVDPQFERIDVALQLVDVLGLAVGDAVVAALHGETVHRDALLLHVEGVAAQGAFVVPLAVAGLFVGLAVEERHQQVAFVVREVDVARIGHDGVHVAGGRAVVVDQHVVQQPCSGVLVRHADRHVVDAVEEEPVLEFERLPLLADVVDDAVHLLVGVGHEVVADEETGYGDQTHEDKQRPGDPDQRHAGRFHGQELVVLAQVAIVMMAASSTASGRPSGSMLAMA